MDSAKEEFENDEPVMEGGDYEFSDIEDNVDKDIPYQDPYSYVKTQYHTGLQGATILTRHGQQYYSWHSSSQHSEERFRRLLRKLVCVV